MKINRSFSKKLEMPASKQLMREVAEFAGLCACAGIHNAPKQARKARGNHYGEFYVDDEGKVKQIPVRRFIWAATHDKSGAEYTSEIVRLIKKGIHDNPTPHTQKTDVIYDRWGIQKGFKVLPGTAQHGTPVFAGRNGYRGLLNKIAEQMAANQFNAISDLNFDGKKHNAASTVRRKGFDHPLEWTHDMEMAIQGWVARQ